MDPMFSPNPGRKKKSPSNSRTVFSLGGPFSCSGVVTWVQIRKVFGFFCWWEGLVIPYLFILPNDDLCNIISIISKYTYNSAEKTYFWCILANRPIDLDNIGILDLYHPRWLFSKWIFTGALGNLTTLLDSYCGWEVSLNIPKSNIHQHRWLISNIFIPVPLDAIEKNICTCRKNGHAWYVGGRNIWLFQTKSTTRLFAVVVYF